MKAKIFNYPAIEFESEIKYPLNYGALLNDIRYVTELSFGENGYTFKAFLPFNLEMEFCFDDAAKASTVRCELVEQIVESWGHDQIIFSNNLDGDIALISTVDDVTGIFKKDRRAGFSVIIAGAPYPLHLVFDNESTAAEFHNEINRKVELCRRQRSRQKITAN